MPKQSIELQWPAGGLHRRYALQQQPPFTSPVLQNVRNRETIAGRYRGGSRPGIGKHPSSSVAQLPFAPATPGSPVDSISSVRLVKGATAIWRDEFVGALGGNIAADTDWLNLSYEGSTRDSLIYHSSDSGIAVADTSTGRDRGHILRGSPSDLDTAAVPRSVTAVIGFTAGFPHTGTLHIYLHDRVNNSSVVVDDEGISAHIIVDITSPAGFPIFATTKTTSYVEEFWAAGASTNRYFTNKSAVLSSSANTFRLLTDSAGVVDLQINGTSVLASTFTPNVAITGGRWGVGCTILDPTPHSEVRVESAYLTYESTRGGRNTSELCVVSGGESYLSGELESEFLLATQVTSGSPTVTLSSTTHIQAQPYLQKIYLADYEVIKSGSNGQVVAPGNLFTYIGASWYVDTVMTADDDATYIVVVDGVGTSGVIGSTTSQLTLSTSLSVGAGYKFWVCRAPKVVDPSQADITTATTTMIPTASSQIPPACPIIFLYQDRLGFAGGEPDPHNWYLSRQGTVTDFNYGADPADVGRAIAGGNSDAGKLAQPITACMPHGDDYLLMASDTQLWIMKGNPAGGGYIDNVSYNIGCVYRTAWCSLPGNRIAFLSKHGVYIISGGTQLEPLSEDKLPQELRDQSADGKRITMAYDIRDRGIHLCINDVEGGATNYWIQIPDGTFWPVTYGDSNHNPYSMYAWNDRLSGDSRVLFGGKDGYVRYHDDAFQDDDGTAFTSTVFIGPFRPGQKEHDGVLHTIIGTLAAQSGNVTWDVLSADTLEQAVAASSRATGTWRANYNARVRPRVRGAAIVLKLSSSAGAAWAIEKIEAIVKTAGMERVA